MKMNAVSIKNLTKKFNGFVAVNNISLNIKKGEIFGFLGPNGAGKTTTISVLCTTKKLSKGTVKLFGIDVDENPDEARRLFGIVFQDPSLDDELTAYENMDFHGRMYGVSSSERKKRIGTLLSMVSLWQKKNVLVKKFSGGMKRRLEIARSLMHIPKLLVLDEPTLGLDPQTRSYLWSYIKQLNADKKVTVLLTTHYIEEAEKLCDRVAIIDYGKVIAIGTPESLKKSIGKELISLYSSESRKVAKVVAKLKWVNKLSTYENRVDIEAVGTGEKIVGLLKVVESANLKIDKVEFHEPTLEDVFLKLTGRSIRDQEAERNDLMRHYRRRSHA